MIKDTLLKRKPGLWKAIKRNLNRRGLREVYRRTLPNLFGFFEKFFHLHVTAEDYYSPIPTTYELTDDTYQKILPSSGINWNTVGQQALLQKVSSQYQDEFVPYQNVGLSLADAFILYAMVREQKPRHIVEIGMGESTKIIFQALKKNKEEGHLFKFSSIDPDPPGKEFFDFCEKEDIEFIKKKVQDVDSRFFADTDLLFIDSSHVSKIDSDVNKEILEIIPSLKKGALVHWHDIWMPKNYPKAWIAHNKFWNEGYLVHAFLLFNDAFQIVWASKFMQINYEQDIQKQLPFYKPNHSITSFWIERIK
ncbi:MAG: class I SAM-dependent methyltransferase [Candidatus Omnitrophica bacterium]|nr:class I SAM-dependent methyltransferase [Candidatus Omnitrophota bacterium]